MDETTTPPPKVGLTMKWVLVGLLIILGVAKPQNAAAYTFELCTGVMLRTTPIYDTPYYGSGMGHPNDLGLVARAGTKVDGLGSVVVDTRSGLRRYCDLRGGACYPVDAIRLLNCSVSEQAIRDGSILRYETILDRSATDQTALRTSDVEETLMTRFGLCHACAGNAAYHYVKEPGSPCGRLVRGALEGDPVATKRLQEAEYKVAVRLSPAGEVASDTECDHARKGVQASAAVSPTPCARCHTWRRAASRIAHAA